MTYTAIDTSVESGQPVELYEFSQNAQVEYFTNAPFDVTVLGITYKAANVSRSDITVTNKMDKAEITLVFPREHEYARRFIGTLQDFVTTVTIKRGHLTDPDNQFIVHWKGRVVSSKAGMSAIEIICESVFTSLKRHGLRARYQKTCRHTLYSTPCGVLQAAHKVTAVVQAVSANMTTLTLTGVGSYADGYFSGGMIKSAGGVLRFITSHTGVTISINKSFSEPLVSTEVDVLPGCDHLKQTCNDKFDNLVNFGGFPYIPTINPFGGSSIV